MPRKTGSPSVPMRWMALSCDGSVASACGRAGRLRGWLASGAPVSPSAKAGAHRNATRPQRGRRMSSFDCPWSVRKERIGIERPSVIRAQNAASFRALARSSVRRATRACEADRVGVAAASTAASDLLDLWPAENAGGHEHEGDGEDRKRRDVLVLDREIGRPHGLDEPDDEPAENRAGERSDAAEHGGGEGLDARHEAVGEA